jgi:hypothetical protein
VLSASSGLSTGACVRLIWLRQLTSSSPHACRSTYDFSADTFPIQYLLGVAALLAYKVNYAPTVLEFFWSFAIYLEAVAFLPQRALLQRSRSGPGDTVDAYYLAALVAYRAFYIANWVQRYVQVGRGRGDAHGLQVPDATS